MWKTFAACARFNRVRLRGLPPLPGFALMLFLIFSSDYSWAQEESPSDFGEHHPQEVEEEETPQPLRAFQKPNRVAEDEAVFSMQLLLIAPILGLLAIVIALLVKPKDHSSVFKEPTPVPRKQKGRSTSSSSEGDGWGSDSTYY